MKVDIYDHKSSRPSETVYVMVPTGNAPPAIKLKTPPLGAVAVEDWKFDRTIDLEADKPRIGVHVAKAVEDLNGKGYHVGVSVVTVTEE